MSASGQGMVVTSQPLAVDAGIELLESGGSAVDAAVAAAAVLTVVDPRSTGLGGDVFALCWQAGDPGPIGLASAGVSPAGLTMDALRDAGHSTMPVDGPWSVTVPGAAAGWEALLGALRPSRPRTACSLRPSVTRTAGSPCPATWPRSGSPPKRSCAPIRSPPRCSSPMARCRSRARCSRFPSSREAWSGSLARARRRSTAETSRKRSPPRCEEAGGALRASDLAEWVRTRVGRVDLSCVPEPDRARDATSRPGGRRARGAADLRGPADVRARSRKSMR